MDSPLDRQLTLGLLRRLLAGRNSHVELVTVVDADSGTVERTTLGDLVARAESLASALAGIGVRPGDRVASLGWNSREHLECFWAIPR
jgi:fatty-acyl-CoA synthase